MVKLKPPQIGPSNVCHFKRETILSHQTISLGNPFNPSCGGPPSFDQPTNGREAYYPGAQCILQNVRSDLRIFSDEGSVRVRLSEILFVAKRITQAIATTESSKITMVVPLK